MPQDSHRQILCYDKRFGHWFVPNQYARVMHERGGYFVKTNKMGARCDHMPTKKKAGVQRILVLGDSFTAGDGVDNSERYTERLEQLLPNVEVFNLGLPGSGTDQQSLVHDEFAKQIDPDVLIFAPLAENIHRNVSKIRRMRNRKSGGYVYQAKPYFTLGKSGEAVVHNVPVPKNVEGIPEDSDLDHGGRFETARKLANMLVPGLKSTLFKVTRYQPLPEYDDPNNQAWLLMSAIIERTFNASNASLKILAPLPYYVHIEELAAPNYLKRFRRLADDRDWIFLDPLLKFSSLSSQEKRACRYADDVHYTPSAHQRVAEFMAESLKPVLGQLA